MVVFTCNHCGDSLQKPKVEKHYAFACRTVKSLTCVDCFKDFRGEEYVTHTKCLTEDERYAAKGTYQNGIVKKGEVKQESWVEMIKSILDKEPNLKPSCRNLLSTISNYNNIPRKKPKFMNFIKSSSGGRVNMKDIEEVWNIIEKYKNEQTKNKNQNNGNNVEDKSKNNQTDTLIEEKVTKDKENTKKRKTSENLEENVTKKNKKHKVEEEIISQSNEEHMTKSEEFSFQNKILEILIAKRDISLKKLQKKVFNAYLKATGETEVSPKLTKKFDKKLKKLSNVEIIDNRVVLLEIN